MKLLGLAVILFFTILLFSATFDNMPFLNNVVNSETVKAFIVALVGAVATISTRKFMANDALFKSEISKTMEIFSKDMLNSFHIFQMDNEKSHQSIEINVSEVKEMAATIQKEVDNIKTISNSKSRYRKEFQTAISNNLRFLCLTPELKEFSILKCSKFFDFVMDIHNLGFDTDVIDIKVVRATGVSIANQIKEQGGHILGEKFMKEFYTLHMDATNQYFDDIEKIVVDKANSKHERFQEISINFMNEFCALLFKFFIANNGGDNATII